MKIAHVQHYYEPEIMYQETALPFAHANHGNQTLVITSNVKWPGRPSGTNTDYSEGRRTNRLHNVEVLRLRTRFHFRRHAMPLVMGVFRALIEFEPDIVFLQGLTNPSLVLPVVRYAKKSKTPLGIISHMNLQNSSYQKNILSKAFHIFWRKFYARNLSAVTRFLPVEQSEADFLRINYQIPEEKISILRLGGWIKEISIKKQRSAYWRREFSISANSVVFIHVSRINDKKGVLPALQAFNKLGNSKCRFVLLGPIMTRTLSEKANKAAIVELARSDRRIVIVDKFLPNSEIMDMAMLGDIGVYYGSETIAARELLCLGIPLLVKEAANWKYPSERNAVRIILDEKDLFCAMSLLLNDEANLAGFKEDAAQYAAEELDWNSLALKSISLVVTRERCQDEESKREDV